MSWTAPSDHSASLISLAEWNNYLGASGNQKYLKDAVDAAAAACLIPTKAQGNGGTVYGGRAKTNYISGANIVVTVADNPGSDRIDVTLASPGGAAPSLWYSSGVHDVVTNTVQGAYGAYTEMFASTAADTFRLLLIISAPNLALIEYYFTVGVGPAASEVAKIPDIYVFNYLYVLTMPVPVDLAVDTGSRIAVKAANLTSASQCTVKACVMIG